MRYETFDRNIADQLTAMTERLLNDGAVAKGMLAWWTDGRHGRVGTAGILPEWRDMTRPMTSYPCRVAGHPYDGAPGTVFAETVKFVARLHAERMAEFDRRLAATKGDTEQGKSERVSLSLMIDVERTAYDVARLNLLVGAYAAEGAEDKKAIAVKALGKQTARLSHLSDAWTKRPVAPVQTSWLDEIESPSWSKEILLREAVPPRTVAIVRGRRMMEDAEPFAAFTASRDEFKARIDALPKGAPEAAPIRAEMGLRQVEYWHARALRSVEVSREYGWENVKAQAVAEKLAARLVTIRTAVDRMSELDPELFAVRHSEVAEPDRLRIRKGMEAAIDRLSDEIDASKKTLKTVESKRACVVDTPVDDAELGNIALGLVAKINEMVRRRDVFVAKCDGVREMGGGKNGRKGDLFEAVPGVDERRPLVVAPYLNPEHRDVPARIDKMIQRVWNDLTGFERGTSVIDAVSMDGGDPVAARLAEKFGNPSDPKSCDHVVARYLTFKQALREGVGRDEIEKRFEPYTGLSRMRTMDRVMIEAIGDEAAKSVSAERARHGDGPYREVAKIVTEAFRDTVKGVTPTARKKEPKSEWLGAPANDDMEEPKAARRRRA